MTSADDVREVLGAAAEQPAPTARPEFVRDLEHRLATTRVGTDRSRRPSWRALAAVAAAAAAVAAFVVLRPGDPDQTVVTEPAPAASTSTSTSTVTTTTTATTTPTSAPTTTSTTADATTTTGPAPTAPTTTTTPTATTATTRPTTGESMRMSCATDATTPAVSCKWSASTSPSFAAYRLTKRVARGATEEVGTTTDPRATSMTDTDVERGTRITYTVEAVDGGGNVIGRADAAVTCC